MFAKLLRQGGYLTVNDDGMGVLEDLPFLRRAFDFFLFLKNLVVLRKFTVSPQYSCLPRMSATAAEHQLYGTAGGLLQFLPILPQCSVGVGTLAAFSRLAICVGPSSSTPQAKCRCVYSTIFGCKPQSFNVAVLHFSVFFGIAQNNALYLFFPLHFP